MRSVDIVVLVDREDRGRALAEAVRPLTGCRIVGPDATWTDLGAFRGVIADIALDRPEVRRCLRALSDRRVEPVPMIYLARSGDDATLREARRLGATACLSALTDPSVIVAALFRQIDPARTLTDLLVARCVARAAILFADLFETGRIDLGVIEEVVDPVLQVLRRGGLRRWLDLIRAHDDATVRHCLHVAGLVANFAVHLGLSEADRTALVRAGLVHDVGKARIPLAILNKPGPLDAAEMAVMRTHAALGHAMLLAAGMTDPFALSATRHHHEMLDGSGYPDRLHGEAIGDVVRLLTTCDIYAALTEPRPYRPAMPQSEALQILRRMAPAKLEPALVEAFAASLADAPPAPRPAGPMRLSHR